MACPPRDEPLVGFTEDRTPTHQRVRGGDGGVCQVLAAGELASRSQLDEASARPPPAAPASKGKMFTLTIVKRRRVLG